MRRARMLGEMIRSALRAASVTLCAAYARYRSYRDAKATCDALRELDDRILRDLGFGRSEIQSVVAEHYGFSEATRRRGG